MRIAPRVIHLVIALALLPAAAPAAAPPCNPCTGIQVTDPGATAEILAAGPALHEEARLYVRWRQAAAGDFDGDSARALEAAGATPWLALVFSTPAPVLENLARFEAELEAAARTAAAAGPGFHFTVSWEPEGGFPEGALDAVQYAFLFKRASVALSGASSGARILPQRLPVDEDLLRTFFDEGAAAYLDGVALAPPGTAAALATAQSLVRDLEAGLPLILDARAWPQPASAAVATAARDAAGGVALVFFNLPGPTPEALAPLIVIANEFQGDLSFDPYSVPRGDNLEAWTFVRGSDLGLRVIVADGTPEDGARLLFSDPQLRSPEELRLEDGTPRSIFGLSRTPEGLGVELTEPRAVYLLKLERVTAAELEGIEETLDVAGDRIIPVEEILRRLQAFEDAQNRRLRHYRAINTSHMRFGGGGGTTVEATFEGGFFYRRDQGFDWAWESFYINGVKWRGKSLPELPIIQPEKVAALPLEIHFNPNYRYRLRGSATIDGRDTWVVDFEPHDVDAGTDENLYQGTVWVDREHYGRVRTRTLQLGLEGEVISNEETVTFSPVDDQGQPAPWDPTSFWLPLRTVGQQIISIVTAPVVVERENVLTGVKINGKLFHDARAEALASDATMVRDTDRGLRYLVKEDDSGDRVVQEEFDTDKLFALGGFFYDDALDYPLPLAGIDYFSRDFRGTGHQVNVFFGGVLINADYAAPQVWGSKADLGVELFTLALPLTDTLYRDDREILAEEVERSSASVELNLGRPLGSFFHLGLSYELGWRNFGDTDETAEDFVIPSDHLVHALALEGRYSRSGYRFSLSAQMSSRGDWEAWGTPAQVAAFDPATEEFLRWDVRLAKSWYLPRFQKLSAEIDYAGGEDLDRFSKYQFGFFGPTRVHGYQSNRVRAEEALAVHTSYGLNLGEILRLEGVLDAVWATDEATGLDNELLAGAGLVGNFIGPWQTIIQVDLGVPVAGPDDGFVAYLVFLKLFR